MEGVTYLRVFCWLSPGCELWTAVCGCTPPGPTPNPPWESFYPTARVLGWEDRKGSQAPGYFPASPAVPPTMISIAFWAKGAFRILVPLSWSHRPVCTPCPYPETLRKILSHPSVSPPCRSVLPPPRTGSCDDGSLAPTHILLWNGFITL